MTKTNKALIRWNS